MMHASCKGSFIILTVLLSIAANALAVTPPNLGSTATYAGFSGEGAIGNTGLSQLTGDLGTNAGAFTGFPPGQYSGAKHVADPAALAAKNDLIIAWNQAGLIPCDTMLNVTLGNGQVLTPRTYCTGPASTITGSLTFDAKGNQNAVFVVKVGGALNVANSVHIILLNGAQAANIYWRVDGAVSILDNSIFKGTIISNGAIHLYGGSTLEGRALALVGAITFASNLVAVPVAGGIGPDNTLMVISPAPGDSIASGTKNYTITWAGTGIHATKTLEYSVDGGLTWKKIAEVTTDTYEYKWNLPDTVSANAFVRITDKNGLMGKSGQFTITAASPGTKLAIVTPRAQETISGAQQNYQITWTATGVTPLKTLEYSLDGGSTWHLIASVTSDALSYSWNVPDTASVTAVVRITDNNGVTARSEMFTISKTSVGSLIVVKPAAGETIEGDTRGYMITWSGTGIAASKTIEYSLDNGSTWQLIGTITSEETSFSWGVVPNIATTTALVRITDANNVRGTSGLFSITHKAGVGSINSLTLAGLDQNRNIANATQLGISWTFTPEIGATMKAEVTLDHGMTWQEIATLSTTEAASTTWTTPTFGIFQDVTVRITSANGMQMTSAPFSIGSSASVSRSVGVQATSMTYPNPVVGAANIIFALEASSEARIVILNAAGAEVATTATQYYSTGTHTVRFDASNLSAGQYTYMIVAGKTLVAGKMIVVK